MRRIKAAIKRYQDHRYIHHKLITFSDDESQL